MSGFDKEPILQNTTCMVFLHEQPDAFLARTNPSLGGIHSRICGTSTVALRGDKSAIESLLAEESRRVMLHYSFVDVDGPDKKHTPTATPRPVNKKQLVQIGFALFALIAMAMALRAHAAARLAASEM